MIISTKEAATALGYNARTMPEQLIRKLVRRELGLAPEKKVDQIIIDYINGHEPLAQMEFLSASGEPVEDLEPKKIAGLVNSHALKAGDNIALIKTPFGLRNSKKPEFKPISEQPTAYVEIQLDMHAHGYNHGYFYQWAPAGDNIEVVNYDKNYVDEILVKLCEFAALVYSELDNPAHAEDEFKEINTLMARDLIDKYDTLSAQIEDATALKNQVLEQIIDLCDNKPALIHGRKLLEVERKGAVDYKKVPELKGIDLEQYRKKSSKSWRLS